MRLSVVGTVLLSLLAGCAGYEAPITATEGPSGSGATGTAALTESLSSGLRVHFVDVGQGDAVVIELPNHEFIIYDCGDDFSNKPLLAYLRDKLGLAYGTTIHALVASHGHEDHIAGCDDVLNNYQLRHVYDVWYQGSDATSAYRSFQDQVKADGAQLHVAVPDEALDSEVLFQVGDFIPMPPGAETVVAQILFPSTAPTSWDRIADHSIVLRVSYGSVDFCFQGDIEQSQETALAQSQWTVDCDVYLVGHHGSRYASSQAWLAKMDPEYAVVSFGKNSYGHPTSEALCRVQQAGANVYATHRNGNVVLTTGGQSIDVGSATAESTDYCLPASSYWATSTPTPTTSTPRSTTSSSAAPPPPSSLSVSAYPSSSTPCRYSQVTIYVSVTNAQSGSGVGGASVTSEWHYKTTTSYESGATNSQGSAALTRSISSATAGYTVQVDVSATYGSANAATATSFTPQNCN